MSKTFKAPMVTGLMLLSAALGSATTYFALQKKHKEELDEVQEFYREFYEKLYEAKLATAPEEKLEHSDTETEQEEEAEEPVSEEPIDISAAVTSSPKDRICDTIYTIDPDQYGEMEGHGWTNERYVYYAGSECFVDSESGCLVDEDDVMEATDDMATDHFGDFEEDAAYFRNEQTKTDIVIYLDPGTYDE